jgi:hypothetical protein
MKVAELVKAATTANPRVFEKVDEKTATAVATAIVTEIGEQIDALKEGRLAISGLGNFVIKQVDGTTAGTKQKRVLLRRPAAK